jgi:hypothetical protein
MDNIKTLTFTTPRDQTVSVRLQTSTGVALSAYSLSSSVVTSPCADDSLEPNDTPATARTIAAPGLFPRLNKCEDDDDWYAVVVPAGRRAAVHANFNATGRVDFDLQVFSNAAGTTAVTTLGTNNGIAVASPTAIGAETIEWKNNEATAQTYYVKVITKGRARQGYDLMAYVDVDGDDAIFSGANVDIGDGPEDRACPDALENNDAATAARAIQIGAIADLQLCVGTAAGFPANDPDWYSVFVPAGATLTVNAGFAHADGDIDVALFRSPNSTTVVANGDSVTDNETVTATNMGAAESYLIRVQGKNTTTRFSSLYSLTTSLSFSTPCTPNPGAGRDKAGAAATMGGAFNALPMCESSEDWYRLSLAAGDTVLAGLEVNNRFGELSLQLINSADAVIASATASANVQEIDHTVSAAGTYYLRVFRKDNAFFRTTYDLWLATDSFLPDAPFCPDSSERNDTPEEAATYTFSTQRFLLNQIMCGADSDHYALGGLVANTEYVVNTFFNANPGTDVDLQIVNAAGQVVAPTVGSGTSTGNDEHITFRTPLAATFAPPYYLTATNQVTMSPSAADYQLYVSTRAGACADDSFEPNNDSGQAKPLLNVPGVYGMNTCFNAANSSGNDFFVFSAARAGTVRVTVMHEQPAINFLVRVFDETRGTLRTANSMVNGRKVYEATNVAAGESFEIQISNSSSTSGPYILQIEN